jgi:SAM-dependent methyltransferase
MNLPLEETTVAPETAGGLPELKIRHPLGTFALTPASLISLRAIGEHRELLSGQGLDWGSGTGCLAIAAAKIPQVRSVVGLEIGEASVVTARENAIVNGVEGKVTFLLSDSFAPKHPDGQETLRRLEGSIDFLLSNPPSSEGDDGFGYRRIVLRGARRYLVPGSVVFLSVSHQYGRYRVERVCEEAPGFAYGGILSSTDWVPFDLRRPDLLRCLALYAEEERRGGAGYTFQSAETGERLDARAALDSFKRSGVSPLSKWQTHLFVLGERDAPHC